MDFLKDYRKQWDLFWDTVKDAHLVESPSVEPMGVENIPQIAEATRLLSKERKKLYTLLEQIQHRLEIQTEKVEQWEGKTLHENQNSKTLEEDLIPLLQEMEGLADQGLQISQELQRVDENLKWLRRRRKALDKLNKSQNLGGVEGP